MRSFVFYLVVFCFLISCLKSSKYPSGLPVIGFKQLIEKEVNGKKVIDSIDHVIPPFIFINQDSNMITEKVVEDKIYLVDFFFTSCPTICPKVKKNMKKVYNEFKHREDFLILSHSIDVKYDTVGRLAWYAGKFNISSKNWHLLTGTKEDIYKMSYQYYITAIESKDAPGGFDHSGYIALVDRNRKIRGMYDGTEPEKINNLIRDLKLLFKYE